MRSSMKRCKNDACNVLEKALFLNITTYEIKTKSHCQTIATIFSEYMHDGMNKYLDKIYGDLPELTRILFKYRSA